MDDRRRPREIISRLVGWILSLTALVFLIKWVTGLGGDVWVNVAHLNYWLVGLAAILFMPFFIFRAAAWESISRQAGYSGHRWENWKMWALSELARYVPGNIWSFAVRYKGARDGGVVRSRSISSLAIEAAALVGGASIVAAITLPVGRYMYIATAIAIVMLIGLIYAPRLIARFRPAENDRFIPAVTPLLFRYLLAWAFYGAATATLWLAFPEHNLMTWLNAFGANVAAWLAGYLSIITPMGLGVREVAFVAMVPAGFGAALAGLVAIITRLMMALTELVFVGVMMIIGRKKS